MKLATIAFAAALLTVAAAHAQQRVGEVSTTFRFVGPNDKIVIERYDDPKVENVSCYLSRADTGGLSGMVGLAEDPARFSIACRATGKPRIVKEIDRSRDGEIVFDQRASALFKELRVNSAPRRCSRSCACRASTTSRSASSSTSSGARATCRPRAAPSTA